MDGGQVALTGFAVQVAVAVLDSFASAWTEVTIEPSSETAEYEKVDILWRFPNADVEFVQVKRSKNAFGPGKIEEWANELRDSVPAARKRLVLLGVPSAGGRAICEVFAGVNIKVVPGEFEVLLDACAHRIRKQLEDAQIPSTSTSCDAAARALVGQLLLDAKDGRTWSRSEIESIVAELATQAPAEPPPSADVIAWNAAARERIRLWVVNLIASRSGVAIEYSEVDFDLELPVGTTRRFLSQSIPRFLPASIGSSGWYLLEEGAETFVVRFKLPQERS